MDFPRKIITTREIYLQNGRCQEKRLRDKQTVYKPAFGKKNDYSMRSHSLHRSVTFQPLADDRIRFSSGILTATCRHFLPHFGKFTFSGNWICWYSFYLQNPLLSGYEKLNSA